MRLEALAQALGPEAQASLSGEAEVSGLAYDSRAANHGDLFFCVGGFRLDGHRFAADAVAGGAVALVVERPLGLGVPELRVASVRAAMGPIAARFHEQPSRRLRVIGVTGTNGKTTTAYLVRALLEATGTRTGMLGTVKSVIAGRERAVERTTPEAIDLQADLRAMLDGGDRACAMEVSSHALALGRTDGIEFAAAVFTNLTQDHLDFHPTMEDYFLAKRLLFVPERGPAPALSVVNGGDPYGRRLAAQLPQARTFALDADADYTAADVRFSLTGARFELRTPDGARGASLPLPGRFNVANALAALATVHGLGGDLDALVAALAEGVRVPGRLEPVDCGQGFAALVDYAHTPDSLQNVLAAAGELARAGGRGGRVICVFGAGGDRDRAKRPLMGAAAARLAELAIVTSDNPRSEDPEAILAEVMGGARAAGGKAQLIALTDRREAIFAAVGAAAPGDVLVVAGKGHEQGQELAGGRKLPFDDVTVLREALEGQLAGAPGSGA